MTVETAPTAQRRGFPRAVLATTSLAVLELVSLAWSTSTPGGSTFSFLLAVVLVLTTGLAWLGLLLAAFARRRTTWHHVLVPLVLLLSFALLETSLPLEARWRLSEGAFNREVAKLPVGTRTGVVPAPRHVGSYSIDEVALTRRNGVLVTVSGAGFPGAGAFAYLPLGPAEDSDNVYDQSSITFDHLDGHWYSWVSGG